MQAKKMARNSGNCSTPVNVHRYDKRTFPILSDYEHATKLGGLLIAISFGAMMLVGAWFGWI